MFNFFQKNKIENLRYNNPEHIKFVKSITEQQKILRKELENKIDLIEKEKKEKLLPDIIMSIPKRNLNMGQENKILNFLTKQMGMSYNGMGAEITPLSTSWSFDIKFNNILELMIFKSFLRKKLRIKNIGANYF